MITDYRRKATAAQGSLRLIAAHTTKTALAIQRVHNASPVAAAAMGRLATAAAILSSDFKDPALMLVEVEGSGPLGRVVAEVRDGGRVRAKADHPHIELPLRADGKLAVGQAVGVPGVFRVTREDSSGALYQGQVALVSGEIGEDFAQYYTLSEQIPSAVAVGVLVGTSGEIMASGGLVIQALPGSQDVIDTVIERLPRLAQISHRLANHETIEALAEDVIGGAVHWFDPEPIYYGCECSETRSLEILSSLPRVELEALIENKGAEVVCHYCHSAYHFSLQQIEQLLIQAAD
ncbi:MAG: Hsp33 family molecular chaperone HslO [Sulfobacillus thermosulfidooxidans]|nr:Hsp33 family molecular chaperone HslO [Sulfobacillus sp. hq2]PSR37192.1 MAG: Hsp33 family molecular chaperone HslO [Sulfobacillus thermosulfidooxidans]